MVKKDEQIYTSNPTNGYVSRWRGGFFGCLGCGSDNHRFASCSKKTSRKSTNRDQTAQKNNNNNKEARWYAILFMLTILLSNPKKQCLLI